MFTLDLRDFLAIIKKRWIIVAAITIVVTGAILAYSWRQKPVYEARATCMVSATAIGESQFLAIQTIDQLIQTFNKIAVSRPVLEDAATKLGGNKSLADLQNEVSSSVVTDTQIIDIEARDRYPGLAALKANAVADSLIAYVNLRNGASSSYKIEKIESAVAPSAPVSPKPIRNGIIGCFLGLVLGLACAIVIESVDVSVKSKEELSQLMEVPVLAEIPRAKGKPLGGSATDLGGDSGILESIRTLRTNIQFVDIQEGLHSILIGSPNVGEGKTFVSEQLARAFAAGGKSVVLVDADLRKVGHQPDGASNPAGLTDAIMGKVKVNALLQKTETDRLWRLPSGTLPPNPSELLDSVAMQGILGWLRNSFDIVVIDSSPAGMFSDPLTLASMADGTILVVEAGSTSSKSLRAAGDLFAKPNVKMLGTVLNKVKPDKLHRTYNYR